MQLNVISKAHHFLIILHFTITSTRGKQIFRKDQIINILGYVEHTVSVATTQLCHRRSSHRREIWMGLTVVAVGRYLQNQAVGGVRPMGHCWLAPGPCFVRWECCMSVC